MYASFFSLGFRPFFFLCALVGLFNPLIWMLNYSEVIDLKTIFSSNTAWHGFEMLFAYGQFLITGFLLTASSHWADRPPIKNTPLLILFLIGLFERFIPYLNLSFSLSLFLFNLYGPLFLGYLISMLFKNRNQYIMTPIVFTFFLAKLLFLWGDLYAIEWAFETGKHLAVMSLILLIVIFSGRIMPMFCQRYYGFRPAIPKKADLLTIISILLLFIPKDTLPIPVEALFLAFAFIMGVIRLYYWQFKRSFSFPLLGILHMGQAFLCLSFALNFLALFTEEVSYAMAPLHAYTVGSFGLFSLGMILRVSKGHSGRELTCDKTDKVIIHSAYLCAFLRFLPFLTGQYLLTPLLITASLFWTLCFFLYLKKYIPILTSPPMRS